MNTILTVMSKEIRDNLRDRKSLLNSLLTGPLILLVMLLVMGMADKYKNNDSDELEIAARGAHMAPNLRDYLLAQGIRTIEVSDPREMLQQGKYDLALIIHDNYSGNMRQGLSAPVTLMFNGGDTKSLSRVRQLEATLNAYGERIGKLRLLARGFDFAITEPIRVNIQDTADNKGVVLLTFFLPYTLFFSIFMGGFYLIIDTTTGERERGSLEPLLAIPLARWQVLFGKLGAAMSFMLATALMVTLVLRFVPGLFPDGWLPVDMHLKSDDALAVLAITLPLIFLFAAIQMLLATLSRSVKVAQTWLGLVGAFATLPAIIGVFLDSEALWIKLLPLLSQQQIIAAILKQSSVSAADVLISCLGTLTLGAAALIAALRLYYSERLLAGA